jgi:hypothetical protein
MPIRGSNDTSAFQYGITLGMLIPALKGQRIPLFLFDKQRILLTFEFNTSEKYVNGFDANKRNYPDAAATQNGIADTLDVVPEKVRLVVDYIVIPSDTQNEILAQTQKQGGYRLEFYDVANVEKNIVQGTNGQTQAVEHRIGQNNREVHNIYMWKEAQGDIMNENDGANGNKRGQALLCGAGQQLSGFGKEEYNCNIDGRDEFDHKVFHPVSQYNELAASLGRDLAVPRPMYLCDDNTTQSRLALLPGGFSGAFKPLALSLRNGEPLVVGGGRMIGNYPIIWKWQRDCNNAAVADFAKRDDVPVKVNYFCEVSRVANIMNTGKGMNVIVSY